MRRNHETFDVAMSAEAAPSMKRNVCLLAHVDHGKTTLADHFVSSNNIISPKCAGKLRFLDSRYDEQQRQITMKLSSITVGFRENPETSQTHWITIIDCPGHADFSVEVAAAARLCDGALILIDVIEGVCDLSRHALHRAYTERLRIIVIFTKMDRLFQELQLQPTQIYLRLSDILCEINSYLHQVYSEEKIANDEFDDIYESEKIDEKWDISPSKGNVVFSSAKDGWAFDIPTFALIIAKNLGIKESAISGLTSALWGDYYLDKVQKKIYPRKADTNKEPMAATMMLSHIAQIYEKNPSLKRVDWERLLSKLHIAPPSDEESINQTDRIKYTLSNWLPLARNILARVLEIIPSPSDCVQDRLHKLCPPIREWSKEKFEQSQKSLVVAFGAKCMSADLDSLRIIEDDETCIRVSRSLILICRVFLGRLTRDLQIWRCGRSCTQENLASSVGSSRVRGIYCIYGRDLIPISEASAGQIVALTFAESHSCSNDDTFLSNADEHIFLQDRLDSTSLLKSKDNALSEFLKADDGYLTLSSDSAFPELVSPYSKLSTTLVRVSIEPERFEDADVLFKGLIALSKVDPAIELSVLSSGEICLGSSGEVHLEKSLKDLRNVYAQIPLKVSPLIISVREGFKNSAKLAIPASLPWLQTQGTHCDSTIQQPPNQNPSLFPVRANFDGKFEFCVFAQEMPLSVLTWMEDYKADLTTLIKYSGGPSSFSKSFLKSLNLLGPLPRHNDELILTVLNAVRTKVLQFCDDEELFSQFLKQGECNKPQIRLAWDLLALCSSHDSKTLLFWSVESPEDLDSVVKDSPIRLGHAQCSLDTTGILAAVNLPRSLVSLIPFFVSGFTLASEAGPLAEEPIMGVVFFLKVTLICKPIESAVFQTPGDEPPTAKTIIPTSLDYSGSKGSTGRVISVIRDCCRSSLLVKKNMRIYEPLMKLGTPLNVKLIHPIADIFCGQAYLGPVHGILSKRRCQIISEDLCEGTSLFAIKGFLPMFDSLGLVDDLRSKASGNISVNLAFNKWSQIDEDPFDCASDSDETNETESSGKSNSRISRQIITYIRERKGLITEQRLINEATKQKTLSKHK